MTFNEKVQSMTSEDKIQYIFNSLNVNSVEYLENVKYLLKNDPSPIVRHEAAYIFGELKNEECSISLLKAINTDSNRFVIREALLALSNRGEIKYKSEIKKLLTHSDSDMVDTAIISLQRLHMKQTDFNLSLSHAKNTILDLEAKLEERVQASFVLMNNGSNDSVDILIKALNQESNAIVKHEIIFSLGETASKKAATALNLAIKLSSNDFVIHETLLSLSTLGFKEYCETIQEYFKHTSAEVAESAEIAFERLNCFKT